MLANAQYSRRECLDVVSIPREMSGEVLEEKVLNIIGKLGCDILLTVLRCVMVLVEQMILQLLSFLDERTASMSGALRRI